ncbi:DNA sulfur modification protein DndB [Photobacterium leiognathi]|uniref:DNA sulfur modification protein DndB n=1 Tax=Photobacterium leiognathi TaxID=553611 RepID=UPI0029810B90|nr:DNA sulfur modification protein DndB [Photobacterium leiognathi]
MTILACVRGTMGSHNYYTATVNARDLTQISRPANQLDKWATFSIEERFQRELNIKRVKEHIAPYLAKNKDRFFGSLIILVYKPKIFEFEAFTEFVKVKLPLPYRGPSDRIGFLSIDGGELILLDGQHRYAAISDIIKGDYLSSGGEGEEAHNIANDDIPVLFIDFQSSETTRRVFNTLNRYAKQMGKNDNLIISEDDGYAISSRKITDTEGPFGNNDKFINWKNNTISSGSTQLTTLNTIYEICKDILKVEGFQLFEDIQTRPSDSALNEGYEILHHWWELALRKVDVYSKGLNNPRTLPKNRKETCQSALLLKPLGQVAAFKAVAKAKHRGGDLELLFNALNDVDLSLTNDLWLNVITKAGGKILNGKDGVELCSDIISYLIHPESFDKKSLDKLNERIAKMKALDEFDLSKIKRNKETTLPEQLDIEMFIN